MLEHSPPESSYALLLDDLKVPHITVWSMHQNGRLIGCGALRELDNKNVEIKSMHTVADMRGQGLGKMMLKHLLKVARERRYERVFLETGAGPGYVAARTMYETHGFTYRGPFADYPDDPNSVYFTLVL